MYELFSYIIFCIIFFGPIILVSMIFTRKERKEKYGNLRYLERSFTDLQIKK